MPEELDEAKCLNLLFSKVQDNLSYVFYQTAIPALSQERRKKHQ